jgi:hypothetical protein
LPIDGLALGGLIVNRHFSVTGMRLPAQGFFLTGRFATIGGFATKEME